MGLPSNTNALQNGFAQGYQIGRSLRFRASASAYLNRTPSVAGNQQKWTWSAWVKRGALGVAGVVQNLLTAGTGDNARTLLFFQDNNTLNFVHNNTGTYYGTITTAVFRDCSAWYHILVSVDTTQATATNRVRIYINSVEQTATSTFGSGYVQQNTNTYINSTNPQVIGANPPYSSIQFLDGYLAEVNLIDGQQLTPSSFGVYDSNGIWQPIKYTGTYGTNGFYLPFSNTTSTTTLVADASGNGNNWTPNNISLTAGATYDSMLDSPTNSNAYGNYCVLNPLSIYVSLANGLVLSEANLQFASYYGGSSYGSSTGTIGFSSGKWYWEVTLLSSNQVVFGISSVAYYPQAYIGSDANGWSYISNTGNRANNNASSSYGTSATAGDVIGVAMDADNGTLTFYKNGSSLGAAFSGLASQTYWPAVSNYYSTKQSINFGQQPFSYTPPSGYKALNTANLPAATISNGANYMASTLYTGNGSTQTINNSSGFYPDFNWIKNRSSVGSHVLVNSVVGGTKQLFSNLTDAEQTNTNITNGISSSGIALGNNTTGTGSTNQNTNTYVAWQWLAGAGTTSTNTSGSITSTVSVSAQSGFSIATYTGTGANATVGHGLGVAPSMYIIKRRNTTGNWPTFHTSITASNVLYLNVTDAQAAYSNVFNATNPTSTVFNIGTSTDTNASGSTYVAYCFAAVRGYSAFGSYTGNGSTDGPFVYTGFRPRFILLKNASAAGTFWLIFDTSRNTYNVANLTLQPESSAAEVTSGGWDIDILSNGFKPRNSGTSSDNGSGNTIIYAAFAESPFNISRAR